METGRDWPECDKEVSFSGIYHHFECRMCGEDYNGYKRRFVCYQCHLENKDEQ